MTKYRIVQKHVDYFERGPIGNMSAFGLRYIVQSYFGGAWFSLGESHETFEEAEKFLLDYKEKEEKSKIPPVVVKEYE